MIEILLTDDEIELLKDEIKDSLSWREPDENYNEMLKTILKKLEEVRE